MEGQEEVVALKTKQQTPLKALIAKPVEKTVLLGKVFVRQFLKKRELVDLKDFISDFDAWRESSPNQTTFYDQSRSEGDCERLCLLSFLCSFLISFHGRGEF